MLWPFYVTIRYAHHLLASERLAFFSISVRCIEIRKRNTRFLVLSASRFLSLLVDLEFAIGADLRQQFDILVVNSKRTHAKQP